MSITIGVDCIGANVHLIPSWARQVAGYPTGSGDVPWTDAQFAAHPGALRIDQSPGGVDPTCDYYDVEAGAGTIARAPGWYREAENEWNRATRPGQRWPGFYASANTITPLVNGLISAGITSGPVLIVANWNLTQAQAIGDVAAGSGPFPVVGIQFADPGPYDINVWSQAWLGHTSGPHTSGRLRHNTDGKQTIGQIAASRNMEPISWCLFQRSMRPLDADDLVGSAVPGAGHGWWTVR